MRRATGVLGLIVGLMVLFQVGGTVATADEKGNNGTIKVHEGNTETEPLRANDPHVCTFHLHGFGFDLNSGGMWWIDQQAPTGTANVIGETSWSANGVGEWRSALQQLPPGHYKVSAKQTKNPTVGGNKQKVFWVECGQSGGGSSTTTGGSSSTTTGGSTSTTTGGSSTTTGGSSSTTTGGSTSTTTGGSSSSTTGGSSTTGTNGTNGSNGNGTTGQGNVTGGSTNGGGQGSITGGNTNLGGQGNVNTSAGEEVAATGESPVQNLPSTSTIGDVAPLAMFGGFLVAFGAFMLRRPKVR
ncbi:MAG TPA: hypothetical protein VM052_06745 [Candidatus Limnocylindrales bacterium]|nr:hypothetical protein [Candidatus Limnocylindrales bacterium]